MQTARASYLSNTKSMDPSNVYCDQSNNTVSFVDCSKTGSAFDSAPPTCVESIFADDNTITLGQFQDNGNNMYMPDDEGQGMLNFTMGLGWRIVLMTGQVYSGSTDESEIEGIYKNDTGQCILVRECE